jgi:outer membrane lipoprotein-sorting protein
MSICPLLPLAQAPIMFPPAKRVGRIFAARTLRSGAGALGRSVRVGALVAFLLVGHGRAATTREVSAVAQWLQTQTNLQTWTAAVRQTRSFKTMAQPLVETGRVWFVAPNRFRWEIGSPAKTIAVREPDQMLVVYPKLKRAERFPLTGTEAGPWKDTLALLEAGFPRSAAELEARFKIVSEASTNGVREIGLQPRAASARRMMPLLKVSFSETDYLLRATEMSFADGSLMRNEFTEGVANPTIDPALFRPEIGPDYQVVDPTARSRSGGK